jgi:DNA helicase TIP49 (TBP-interacting protein)
MFRKGELMKPRKNSVPMNFASLEQSEVPQGRNGKHKELVTKILNDLDQLPASRALKISLTELGFSKEKVRSALNRATHKSGREVATATDGGYLYIWNEPR